MTDELDLALAVATAREAVEAGGRAALRRRRAGLDPRRKADRTLVTAADRESEAEILRVIRERFPKHSVLSEECGSLAGASASADRWIVDPLDGTLGFVRGGSFWGPLVALEHRGAIVAGAAALPALDTVLWAGRGRGCRCNGEPVSVSSTARWNQAVLGLGELPHLLAPPRRDAVIALIATAASARCYGDLAGGIEVLSGRADAWLEAGVQLWDLAALRILIEEAGGRFTDFSGRAGVGAGTAVATNGLLHEHVLEVLSGR
jgi:histidinol-phosphatase